MPNILFASNSVSHFPGSTIGSALWSFDSNRVPYSIQTPLQTKCGSPLLPISPDNTQEWWFHLRNGSSEWYVNSDDSIIEIVDANGARILELSMYDRTGEGYHTRYTVDGVSYTNTQSLPIPENMMRTYDIMIKNDGLNWRAEVYTNELLIENISVPVNTFIAPARFNIGGHAGDTNNNDTNYYYSEIIVADGDTRNARLDLLRPVAVGAYGNWNGPVLSLSDDDPTTGMTTVSPLQSQSTILTPYSGATNISNIVQITTSVRGINSPANLQHLIRMSAVDYLTASIPVPFSKDYQITDWALNPATSLPWAAADLVTAEFGFKSIA